MSVSQSTSEAKSSAFERFSEWSRSLGTLQTSELPLSKESRLLRQILEHDGFSLNIIAIFDHWFDVILPQQIASQTLTTPSGIISFTNVVCLKPIIFIGGEQIPLTPKLARERSYTYSGEVYVDAVLTPTESVGKKEGSVEKRILIGRIPIMMGSKRCHTFGKTVKGKIDLGECPNDPLGYFILKGGEKTVVVQEKLRASRFFTFVADAKGRIEGRITCAAPTGTTVVAMAVGRHWQTLKVKLFHMRKNHHIPLFILFGFLGYDAAKALHVILQYVAPENVKKVYFGLQSSFAKSASYPDPVSYMARKQEMGNVKREDAAIKITGDITRDLFPNVPSIDGKAKHLGLMAAQMMEVLLGVRELDNRDSWGNKRLETAARSMEQLFSGLWKKTILNAQKKIDENKAKVLNTAAMARVVLQSNIITDEFESSFGPNAWGIKNEYIKENITDTLKRETPLSVYSQNGRINTPSSRKAKQISIRMVQPSQLGLVCLAETPEGEGALTASSMVLLQDKRMVSIENLVEGDIIGCMDFTSSNAAVTGYTSVARKWSLRTNGIKRKLFRITTITGSSIEATDDHPFLTLNGWVPTQNLRSGIDALGMVPWVLPIDQQVSESIVLDFNTLGSTLNRIEISKSVIDTYCSTLTKLLPLKATDTRVAILARMYSYITITGLITVENGTLSMDVKFTSRKDAEDFINDVELLDCECTETSTDNLVYPFQVQCCGAMAALFLGLGMNIEENRNFYTKPVPDWVINGSKLVKREFMAGLAGATGGEILICNDAPSQFKLGSISFFPSSGYLKVTKAYLNQIRNLYMDLDVHFDPVEVHPEHGIQMIPHFTEANLLEYTTKIGFRYSEAQMHRGWKIGQYLQYRQRRCISENTMSYREFYETVSINGKSKILHFPIETVERIPDDLVYDITVTADHHSFIASSFVNHNCGLVKNLALTTHISLERTLEQLIIFVSDPAHRELLSMDKDELHPVPLMINGVIHYWTRPEIKDRMIVAKRRGDLPYDCSIYYNQADRIMEYYCDSARPMRPLLVVTDGELVMDTKNLWDQPLDVLYQQGALELIDAREQVDLMLAMSPQDVRDRNTTQEELINSINDQTDPVIRLENEAALAVLERKMPFTHSEIDPVAIFGIAAALIPKPDSNQGPRTTYQASMGKQALGAYHYNHHLRFDSTFKILQHPSRPIFETEIAEPAGLNVMPTGQTPIIALLAMADNNEDAIIVKKEYLDAGNFDIFKYMSHKVVRRQVHGSIETFARPASRRGEPENRYAAIDEHGLPQLGAYIRHGDCIVGKVRTNMTTGKVENASLYAGIGEEGYVDRVLVTWNNDKQQVVKVKIRQSRRQICGDKLASRYSQKGTIGRIVPAAELPRVIGGPNDGLVPDFFINSHCFTGDTPVTTYYGVSKRIDSMARLVGDLVWGWSEEKKGFIPGHQMDLRDMGVRDILQITMMDGRKVRCTPDHKILTQTWDGRRVFVEAQYLIPKGRWDSGKGTWDPIIRKRGLRISSVNGVREFMQGEPMAPSRVVMGLDAPLDCPSDEEKKIEAGWSLSAGQFVFTMNSDTERERALAFVRLLGAVCTDGTIVTSASSKFRSNITLGHIFDVDVALRDIQIITGKRPSHRHEGGVWVIALPAELARAVAAIPEMSVGKKVTQESEWPKFLFQDTCPLSIIREFVGGLFGGDGTAPCLFRSTAANRKDNSGLDRLNFSGVKFVQSVIVTHQESFREKMVSLCWLLEKLGVEGSRIIGPVSPSADGSIPIDPTPRVQYGVNLPTKTGFSDKVGFRYCIQKSMRLTAAAAYWRFIENVERQHRTVFDWTSHIFEAERKKGVQKSLDEARSMFLSHEGPLNDYYSLLTMDIVHNRRRSEGRIQKLERLDYRWIMDPMAFLTDLGILDWFFQEGITGLKRTYIIKHTMDYLPMFPMGVLDVRPIGRERVYDIAVNETHTFLANGLCVTNCLPSRMTMGKVKEILASKAALYSNEKVDATSFHKLDLEYYRDMLRRYGMDPDGNENMVHPNGKAIQDPVFVGPCYYQALRHHVLDKVQMRARGAIKPMSHQPVGGRSNEGGLRIGEMESCAMISHGCTSLLLERLMIVSDKYRTVYCETCGNIAISDHLKKKSTCRVCGSKASFGTLTYPYIFKLIIHMLIAMGINVVLKTKPEIRNGGRPEERYLT